MIILIPSRSRAEKVSKALACEIPHSWHSRTYVFVPQSQYYDYIMHMPGSIQTVALDDDIRISQKRVMMAEWAMNLGERSFLFCDDDVGFLVRRSELTWKLRGQEEADFSDMMSCMEELLLTGANPYSHVGISAREGNNRVGEGPAPLMKEFTRTYRVVGWRTDDYLQLQHGRVDVMEDMDTSIQSLRLGRKNCCLYYYSQGQGSTGDEGGCADWRTREIHDASALRLAELHPGFVTTTERKTKGGGAISERTEVVVQWKKAWESAREWATW